jgi:phosphoribosylformylglycinamidine synthase I
MTDVKAIVLRAAGINCDVETEYALQLAGAQAERVHINRVIEDKNALEKFQIIVIPGGFSYGDDVAAGVILANQIVHHLYEPVQRFINAGKLVLGICNGFQVLVKAGILPGGPCFDRDKPAPAQAGVTITYNDSGKYEDRWVYLAPQTKKSILIEPDRQIYLPVAHAEGKVVARNASVLKKLRADGQIAFKYVDKDGKEGPYPVNPNGSMDSVAGLTDATGRVLGLMPHPERFVRPTQHPHWSRLKDRPDADGLTIFGNAVRYVRENL